MANSIRLWQPSTTSSLEQTVARSREIIRYATSPHEAIKAAKRLIGEWPYARPPDPETYAASIAAVLADYPLGLVNECCDPRTGLARSREFLPTPASVVEWLDARLKHHQILARGKPLPPKPKEPDYSDEHRQGMLARLQEVVHSNDGKRDDWVRPIGPFEDINDRWNYRRKPASAAQPTLTQGD